LVKSFWVLTVRVYKENIMLKELQVDDTALWKQRYRTPGVWGTQLAKAAPTRGLVVSDDKSGICQLYAWDVPSAELRQLTDRPKGQLLGVISPDGRYVYYLEDEQGNEIGHYVRVPFEGGEPEDITPDLPPYSSWSFAVSEASNLAGFTVANPDGFHLYGIDLGSNGGFSAPRLLYHTKQFANGPALSHSGEIAVMASTERTAKLHFSLVAIDTATGEKVSGLWDEPDSSIEPVAFSPVADDFRLLATTNKTGVNRPLIWNPCTGERIDLVLDDVVGEVVPLDWSPDGNRILLMQFIQAVQQLLVYNLETNTLTRLEHPSGSFGLWRNVYFGPEAEIFALWHNSTHLPQLIALDAETGCQTRTVLAAGDVLPGRPWKSVTFTSSDGQNIQGWLGVPKGEGPFPTILETHGGPTMVVTEGFHPGCQAWLDHGFAFLTINYRGSTTFGRDFQDQIIGNPGHWEVEDIVAARAWLVDNGIADPNAILLTGWSYGGYLTLQALGKKPDLWAGGMAGIAVADFAVSYEDEADTLRGYDVEFFGGTPEEKPEQYAASSPITYVENVKAPILIIQGRNDTRTPARSIEMYEEKMKALGKSIEVHWFEAGHLSLADVEMNIAHQELMLRFAHRILSEKRSRI
jgi:dipeptidyl aminopeptidase/acylaminoacyl peptidase